MSNLSQLCCHIVISSGRASRSKSASWNENLHTTHKHCFWQSRLTRRRCWLCKWKQAYWERGEWVLGCFTASLLASDWPDSCFQEWSTHTNTMNRTSLWGNYYWHNIYRICNEVNTEELHIKYMKQLFLYFLEKADLKTRLISWHFIVIHGRYLHWINAKFTVQSSDISTSASNYSSFS